VDLSRGQGAARISLHVELGHHDGGARGSRDEDAQRGKGGFEFEPSRVRDVDCGELHYVDVEVDNDGVRPGCAKSCYNPSTKDTRFSRKSISAAL